MKKQFNRNNQSSIDKKNKNYPIGYIIIATLIFLITILIINVNRTFKYYEVVKEIENYSKEIKKIEYEKKILLSQREAYKSPRRILEVGLEAGMLKSRKENKDDIIYIKINSNPNKRQNDKQETIN